jgi:hypothetical protein
MIEMLEMDGISTTFFYQDPGCSSSMLTYTYSHSSK